MRLNNARIWLRSRTSRVLAQFTIPATRFPDSEFKGWRALFKRNWLLLFVAGWLAANIFFLLLGTTWFDVAHLVIVVYPLFLLNQIAITPLGLLAGIPILFVLNVIYALYMALRKLSLRLWVIRELPMTLLATLLAIASLSSCEANVEHYDSQHLNGRVYNLMGVDNSVCILCNIGSDRLKNLILFECDQYGLICTPVQHFPQARSGLRHAHLTVNNATNTVKIPGYTYYPKTTSSWVRFVPETVLHFLPFLVTITLFLLWLFFTWPRESSNPPRS